MLCLHRQERRAYYLHRYRARKKPERCMTSIADGRDQHATNVTKLRRISKTMSALSTVGTHLVGCIVHSGQSAHGKEVYGSFDYYQFPHDANLTKTVLLDVLVYWTNNTYCLPSCISSLTTVSEKTKTGTCLPYLHFLLKRRFLRRYEVLSVSYSTYDAYYEQLYQHLSNNSYSSLL